MDQIRNTRELNKLGLGLFLDIWSTYIFNAELAHDCYTYLELAVKVVE